MKKYSPPYLGAAYYPEDWPETEIAYDIQKMKEAGITVARIGEFAWKKMEPLPGQYDFAWLHRVVDALAENGIAAVMGTPTATPPKWLLNLYPDVVTVNAQGIRTSHGGRRHCCSNNAHYRDYSARIVEAMAKEFGNDENIIGWQIDNEIYAWDGCCCPNCIGGFHEYLREKYGTIAALNEAWNLNLFSQAYEDFAEIPSPHNGWHNPHLKLEWLTFANDSHIDYVHMQADILHKYVTTGAPIGTDTMPFNGMDYRRLNEKLDIVQFNHYNEPQNEWQCCLWFDYLRGLREHPFWNTETQTCWNGSTEIGQSIKPDGWCRVNSFLPIALGGEANMYWIWRTHWAGHELSHGAVLDASGRPMYPFGEVQDIAKLLADNADFLNGTRVDAKVAFHYTSRNWNMHNTQQMVAGADNDQIPPFYKALSDCGVRVDVIDAEEPLDKYKVVVSPMMMTIEEGDLPARITEWVKAGGTWIVGPLSDIRTSIGTRYRDRAFGILEELTGAKWLYGIADRIGRVKASTVDGKPLNSTLWYDIYDAAEEETLARVSGGHSAIDGKACILRCQVGEGTVILLGTFPAYDALKALYTAALNDAGVENGKAEGEVMVVPRVGEKQSGLILVEYAGKAASYTLDKPMKRTDSGEIVDGKIEIEPYGIVILQNI
ncbi:MAG: beta-galactosidase [Clostridia bacterium]|nr:beta-galactosidase [Clostridia bacterium]